MGIDLIMDIALFWLIYKFAWKKSRIKHMAARGLADNRDNIAFAVFVVAFCVSLFGPILAGLDMFSSFWVFSGIALSYFITTRIRLGACEADEYDDGNDCASVTVGKGHWIGAGKKQRL